MAESQRVFNEPDRVILRGELGAEVVLDVTWSETEGIDDFNELFEIDSEDYPVDIDYYQGIHSWRIITRKSDDRKFGFIFWHSPGNDGMDSNYESNGEDHGIVYEYDDDFEVIGGEAWVFLPVEPSTLPTYKFT